MMKQADKTSLSLNTLKEKARMNTFSFSRTEFRNFKREKKNQILRKRLKLIFIDFTVVVYYCNNSSEI